MFFHDTEADVQRNKIFPGTKGYIVSEFTFYYELSGHQITLCPACKENRPQTRMQDGTCRDQDHSTKLFSAEMCPPCKTNPTLTDRAEEL